LEDTRGKPALGAAWGDAAVSPAACLLPCRCLLSMFGYQVRAWKAIRRAFQRAFFRVGHLSPGMSGAEKQARFVASPNNAKTTISTYA
jgi:hypothetical protein